MGKFVMYNNAGSYRFNLVASNNEIIGTSEQYTTKDGCLNGIDSVRRNAIEAKIEDHTKNESMPSPSFEIFLDKAGEFRFRLRAKNSEIILRSEGYTAKSSCQKGIASVQKNAPDAPVVEKEEE